jgi:spermidine synthase
VVANVRGCQVHIPAFQTLWGFNIASDAQLNNLDVPDELDALVARRLNRPLRFYDGESHTNMFSLPRFIRQSIQQERRVNRDEAPVFMA